MKKRSAWVSSRSPQETKRPLPTFDRIRRRVGSDTPARRRSSRRRRRSAFGRKSYNQDAVVRTSLSLGAVALAVIVITFTYWLMGNKNTQSAVKKPSLIEAVEFKRVPPPNAETAVEIVRLALAVKDPQLVGEHFHLGSSSPQEVIEFLKQSTPADGVEPRMNWAGNVDANGMQLQLVQVIYEQDGKPESKMAILHPDQRETWKIDFASYARLTSPSWKEILSDSSTGGTVRVILAPGSYYNGPFSDDEWFCLRMSSPDVDHWLYGYCRMNSQQAKAIARILENSQRSNAMLAQQEIGRRVVIEIKRTADALDNQFEISRVLAEDWVVQELDYDESF